MTEPEPVRIPLLCFAWELIPGDLVVDDWEGTSLTVDHIAVQARQVVVTYADETTFTATRRPGQEPILDVKRLATELPALAGDEEPAVQS